MYRRFTITEMATFYQRLRHPFRRPTHYYTITEPTQTPRQLARQWERERQRALDEIENDADDGRAGLRDSTSRDSLPVINDRGPYRGCFHPKDQLCFNSIMLATDIEPASSRLPGGELRQETCRTPIWCPRAGNDKGPSPRPVPSEWLTASQNAEALRRWEQCHGINTMPPHSWLPSRLRSSPKPLSPPREPITPGTQEWDKFMGFPLDNSQHIHRGQCSKPVEASAASKAPALSEPADTTETEPALVSRDVDALLQAQSESLLPPGHTSLGTKLPGISPSEAEPTQALTWTSALNCILRDETVDSVARAIITERLQRISSSRRLGHEGTLHITLADVNLVPNFSYPIASSALCDRVDAASAPLTQSYQENEHEQLRQHKDLLSDVVCVNNHSYASSNNSLHRDLTSLNWPLRAQDEDHTPPEIGTPPGYCLRLSSDESREGNVNARQHSPLPRSSISEQVSALLRSILTPSELELHFQTVYETAALGTSPHPGHGPAHDTTALAPLDARLIRKLATALHGLQDRIAGLEEHLIPQLSNWLEQKNSVICEQSVEISHLIDEIIKLKHIADFGNRIISRCQERELEVWLTLLDIQRKHQEKHGRIVRVFSRARSSVVRNTEGPGCSTMGDSAAPALSSAGENKWLLRMKELDALLLMAKQNVDIVDEDMREMAERLQAYLVRNSGKEGGERPVDGSWKNI